MRRQLLSGLLLLSLGLGCVPSVRVQLLEPAQVSLPAEVETLAIVDRSRVAHAGQGFLSAMEGLSSGEVIGGDRHGAGEAIEELIEVLAESPRFSVVVVNADRDSIDSSFFDDMLNHSNVQQICSTVGAQALVSLEVFDSDSSVEHLTREVERERDGETYTAIEHVARRRTRVNAGFRTYSAAQAVILDEDMDLGRSTTREGTGDNRGAATGNLPGVRGVIGTLGEQVGAAYGARIAPTWVWESRSYFTDKDDRLKAAGPLVREGRWEEAAEIWRGLLGEEDPDIRGRAAFNLALHHEIRGELEDAVQLCDQAVVDLDNGYAHGYRQTLERRRYAENRLDQQMAPPPGDANKR